MGCCKISKKQKSAHSLQQNVFTQEEHVKNCASMNIVSSNLTSKSVSQPLHTLKDIKSPSFEQNEFFIRKKELLHSLFINIKEENEQEVDQNNKVNRSEQLGASTEKLHFEQRIKQIQKLRTESDESVNLNKKQLARHIFKQSNKERFKNLQLIF